MRTKRNDGSLEHALEGVLSFYSETGTEGGYWAFQDLRYIQKNVPGGYCKKCGIYLKEQDGSIQIKRIIALDEKVLKEFELTKSIKEKPVCADGDHEEYVGDLWGYEGLHILKDGNRLTIYHPDTSKEVWSGVINLKQYGGFREHASGLWIHADQVGIERDVWAGYFFKEYLARLIPSKGR